MRITYCTVTLTISSTQSLSWTKEEVVSCNITEEIDRTGKSIPINTLTVTVSDPDQEFDITNPSGTWRNLEYDQVLTVTEYVDGEEKPMGTFYLDGWNYKDYKATFEGVCPIGYIQRRTFAGQYYEGATAQAVLDDIMDEAEYDDYELDEDYADREIYGVLPESDCREALRALCVAIGCIPTCGRGTTITIAPNEMEISEEVDIDRKLYGYSSAELEDAVSEVDFSITEYTPTSDDETTLYSGTLPAGSTTIHLTTPYEKGLTYTVTPSSAFSKAKTDGLNITITLTSAATVVITGVKYEAQSLTYRRTTDNDVYADFPTTETYSTPLYDYDNVDTVIDNLLSFYQLRKKSKMKFLLEDEKAGDWIRVLDRAGQESEALLKSHTIDLTGGFISTAELIGSTTVTSSRYYCTEDGEDLIAEDNFSI